MAQPNMEARKRICAACGVTFYASKPSEKRKYCGHKCAFSVIGTKVRSAAASPEAIEKRAAKHRATRKPGTYVKRGGRHEHRSVAEATIGRALRPGEIVHHKDDVKDHNDPDNLEVLPNQAEHARLHNLGKPKPMKIVCKYGHALTADNIKITHRGARRCLICHLAYDAKWRRDKRAKSKKETL